MPGAYQVCELGKGHDGDHRDSLGSWPQRLATGDAKPEPNGPSMTVAAFERWMEDGSTEGLVIVTRDEWWRRERDQASGNNPSTVPRQSLRGIHHAPVRGPGEAGTTFGGGGTPPKGHVPTATAPAGSPEAGTTSGPNARPAARCGAFAPTDDMIPESCTFAVGHDGSCSFDLPGLPASLSSCNAEVPEKTWESLVALHNDAVVELEKENEALREAAECARRVYRAWDEGRSYVNKMLAMGSALKAADQFTSATKEKP